MPDNEEIKIETEEDYRAALGLLNNTRADRDAAKTISATKKMLRRFDIINVAILKFEAAHCRFGMHKIVKPCPFCRSMALQLGQSRRRGYFVACNACLASGPYGETADISVDVWNSRGDN